jgi:predicted enzyme related to lactoylglutathione lyase
MGIFNTHLTAYFVFGLLFSLGEGTAMSRESHVNHSIDYIEFAVTDMQKAKEFYGEAFGWKFNDYAPTYVGIKKENGEAGGFRLESAVATGGPLVILYSDNLESTLGKVKSSGGEITKEPFDFPGGRRFHFKDPSGNELAVWSK